MTKPTVTVAQVEYVRDGAYLPSPELFTGPTKLVQRSSNMFTAISGHATDVSRFLLAGAGPVIDQILLFEATDYCGRGSLNCGLTWDSLPAPAMVENHSWGGQNAIFVWDILQRMDARILRDNVFAFIAVPDGGMGTNLPLMSHTRNSVLVGSSDHGMDELPGFPADILAPDWTSYACPKVAALGAQMVDFCISRGYPYDVQKALKPLMLKGADRRSDGRRILNLTEPLRLLAQIVDGVFVPAPAPVVVVPPAPVPAPVVTPTPTPPIVTPAPDPVVPLPTPTPQPTEDMFETTLLEAAAFSATAPFFVPPQKFIHLLLVPTVDPGKNFANGIYTVPADGTYELSHMVRLADNLPQFSYGAGVGLIDYDFPDFKWASTNPIPPGGSYGRNGNDRTYIKSFKAGDQLRLVVYNDWSGQAPVWAATMSIRRIL